LRQNVAVRPSRARYKIYIIDEVHMLSRDAFNALLKTLEEPPEHVKFIFATTEPNKIPITILSRCQRYDFAGIDAAAIQSRLAQIAAEEGVEADADALQIIAIRAAGSMRDSQSLLEQLLSTGKDRITAADVTELLGLAPAARLSRLVAPLVERKAAAALAEFDAAIVEGAEAGQLIDQLLGYFRDVMTQAVGCDESQLLYALPGQCEEIRSVAQRLGIQTLLAISQVLDQTAARLRISTQVRTLAEMALVRICHLHDLDEISSLLEQLKTSDGASAAGPASKKNFRVDQPIPSQPQALPGGTFERSKRSTMTPNHPRPEAGAAIAPVGQRVTLDEQSIEPVWKQALDRLAGVAADCAAAASKLSVDGQGRLVASFPESHKFSRDTCLRPANLSRIEAALAEACGGHVGLVLTTHHDPDEAAAVAVSKRPTAKQQQADAAAEPFVQRAVELFDADSSRLRYVAPSGEN
jgi:DNA polymerase-3 subunit gamma/tau